MHLLSKSRLFAASSMSVSTSFGPPKVALGDISMNAKHSRDLGLPNLAASIRGDIIGKTVRCCPQSSEACGLSGEVRLLNDSRITAETTSSLVTLGLSSGSRMNARGVALFAPILGLLGRKTDEVDAFLVDPNLVSLAVDHEPEQSRKTSSVLSRNQIILIPKVETLSVILIYQRSKWGQPQTSLC